MALNQKIKQLFNISRKQDMLSISKVKDGP